MEFPFDLPDFRVPPLPSFEFPVLHLPQMPQLPTIPEEMDLWAMVSLPPQALMRRAALCRQLLPSVQLPTPISDFSVNLYDLLTYLYESDSDDDDEQCCGFFSCLVPIMI